MKIEIRWIKLVHLCTQALQQVSARAEFAALIIIRSALERLRSHQSGFYSAQILRMSLAENNFQRNELPGATPVRSIIQQQGDLS